MTKHDIERAIDMRATTIEQIETQSDGARRASWQGDVRHDCADLRWPPAVRLITLVAGAALAWGAVILLSSFLFG